MNKKLKKYAEQQLLSYQNEDFLMELKEKQKERQKENGKSRKRLISIGFSVGGAVVAIAIVLLCVFLIHPPKTEVGDIPQTPIQLEPTQDNPKKEYGVEEKSAESSVEELNSDLQFVVLKGDAYQIKKYIDDIYNDTLYYYFMYNSEDELATFTFKISANPDYKLDGADKQHERQGTVATFAIRYDEEVNCEDDIYFFTESGVIKTDHETIVVTAEIIGFDENSHFIELLNEIIKAK